MQKIKKILVGFLCVITLFSLTGCKDKQSITADTFKSKMESNGYTVYDATSQFSSYSQVKKVYLAANSNYKIEFYELDSVDNAISFFNNNKGIFEESKDNGSIESSKNIKNYSKYTLKTSGKYKVLSRIDNTVILLNVDQNYSKDVNDVLNSLGY